MSPWISRIAGVIQLLPLVGAMTAVGAITSATVIFVLLPLVGAMTA